jgi:L-fuconolactonase
MLAAMDAVKVDAAILVSSFNLYGYDPSYALEVYAAHPERFRVIKPVDVTNPGIDDVVADWAGTEGAVGIRVMLRDGMSMDPADPGVNRAFAAAARHGLPVNFLCWGKLDLGAALVARNPDTVVVIDHLGLLQPFKPPAPAEPWTDLPKVLALAAHDNVRIKISGACTLGSGDADHRCLRARSLHVGHGLDTGDRAADLRAGRRGLSRHRPAVGR